MTSWEIRRPNGKIERFTTAELRARCLAGSVTRETPTRREGAPEWEWAIDVPGMSDVFALPRVHRLIPSLLLPLAAVLIVASYLVDASPMGSHPKGGPETVGVLFFAGAVAAMVGLVVPFGEYMIRRLAIARLSRFDRGADE